jgi:hypothetical protein
MSKKNQNTEAALETPVLITEQVAEVVTETSTIDPVTTITNDKTTNVSQKIRALHAHGLKMGPIVKALTAAGYKTKNGTDIRFQHVRNVLTTQPKKAG